jgi:hypothetical protein
MNKISIKVCALMLVVSLAVLVFPSPARASIPDRLIVGSNYTLESGESLDEDLMVIGGRVTLEVGSTLNGDILMVGGSLVASGKVNGDITVAGGLLEIGTSAVINGDISSAGANLQRDPDAIITGDITTEQEGPFIVTPSGTRLPQLDMAVAPSFSFMGFMLRVILWGLLAMLLALFLPNQLRNVSQTAMSQPLITGGLGLLTLVVLPLVLVLIALTILLIPVSLIGLLLLAVAWVYGLIALGTELGGRFAGIFKSQWHPALAAGVGTFLLMLVVNGIETAIPCLGLLPKIIVGVIGLGAVILTRGGLQPYPPAALSVVPEITPPVE